MEQPSPFPRLVRGLVAAHIATFMALFAHLVGGGNIPGTLGITVPLLVSIPVCILLTGRSLSYLRLCLAVVASQLLFHTLFALGSFDPSPMVMGLHEHAVMAGSHAGHGMHHAMHAGMDSMSGTAPASAAAHSGAGLHAVIAGPTMWAMHALGACVTAGLLHSGESALIRLLVLARRMATPGPAALLLGALRMPVPPIRPRTSPAVPIGWAVLVWAHAISFRRRGPPAFPHTA